jgi:general secretion pathway protein H
MSLLHSSDESGFSLIELIVVIAIIVLISIFAIPGLSSYFQLSLNSATRDIASSIKEAYNATVVSRRVHRLVFDLEKNEFWVESGPANLLLDTKESRDKEERRKKLSTAIGTGSEESAFQMEKSITRKKVSLPRGVVFEDVITQQSTEPLTSGKAFSHFFPNGLSEQTIIHLTDQSKHRITLAISPLLGQTDLYDRYATPNEIFGK